MSSLAEQFRQAGIAVGDIVEIVRSVSGLGQALAKLYDDPPDKREGELVQVTAIGENAILGFWLLGFPIKDGELGEAYGLFEWRRKGNETIFGGRPIMFRKVGEMTKLGMVFTNPEMTNVYSRCQRGIP